VKKKERGREGEGGKGMGGKVYGVKEQNGKPQVKGEGLGDCKTV